MARKEEAEKDNAERWLLTYSDMITLLMLFFIILYSMSTIDAKKYEEMSEALEKTFDGGNFGLFEMKTGSKGSLEGVEKITPPAPKKKDKESNKKRKLAEELRKIIQGNNVKLTEVAEGLKITLFSDIFFASGKTELNEDGYQALRELSPALAQLPNDIRVEGHSDATPVALRPGIGSNWDLSARRALVVLGALESYGVPSEHLAAVARGSTKPLRPNDTEEGRSYNRRVDIIIVFQSDLPDGTAPPESAAPAEAAGPAEAAPPAPVSAGHGGH